jgi:hypothetical protein
MHALNLPPRHTWRVALLALLLAFAMTLFVQIGRLDLALSGGGSAPAAAAPAPSAPARAPSGRPDWASRPLAPATLHLR